MSGDGNPIFGTTRSKSVRDKISKTKIARNYTGRRSARFGKISNSKCSFGKGSYYKNIWMRSSWEVKYAKYLDKNKIEWLYESKTFDLGNTTYTPDFYLHKTDEYIEIKGRWLDNAKDKFNLFKKLYKNINITVLMKEDLKQLEVL
jgi:predicted nuclease of restriction endonuclease-like RecB superfamily